jgi:hypothetical protein
MPQLPPAGSATVGKLNAAIGQSNGLRLNTKGAYDGPLKIAAYVSLQRNAQARPRRTIFL